MKRAKTQKRYKLVLENGQQLFSETYSEEAAERIWENYNGVYTVYDDNDSEQDKEYRIFIEEA